MVTEEESDKYILLYVHFAFFVFYLCQQNGQQDMLHTMIRCILFLTLPLSTAIKRHCIVCYIKSTNIRLKKKHKKKFNDC